MTCCFYSDFVLCFEVTASELQKAEAAYRSMSNVVAMFVCC